MIRHPAFTVEEWAIHETELHLDILSQTESIFALSNGHIGLRGNLDEGEPSSIPGTYLNSVYELRTLPYAETAYGYPESDQTVINVTNGKIMRLLVDDEPFDVRYGELQSHERVLDFRAGTLRREVCWTSPAGCSVKVSSTRLVSFSQRAIAAISYEVEALDTPTRIVLQSELVANEAPPDLGRDPRAGMAPETPLECEEHLAQKKLGLMIHRTKLSQLRVGTAMDHSIEGPGDLAIESDSSPNVTRVTITVQLQPGERLRVIKFLAYGWSSTRSQPAVHDQVLAALSAARRTGWDGLLAEQRAYLNDFWQNANVELEGDAKIQQALRFALFHVLQAGARGERRPLPAKGLTGPGYDGHAFWDTESFVLPMLTLILPHAVGDALRWRQATLPQAKDHARQLGLRGSAFPWRTIHGEECSGYWPAGTAAFHINADIAYATGYYIECTGDMDFEEKVGLELLVETARLWLSLGYHDSAGWFRLDGVTGPDEYSAIADNNVYTNLMAQYNLRFASKAVQRHPHKARALGVDLDELTRWRAAAEKMFLPHDEQLGVTPQDESFTRHEVWNFADTAPDQYPLLLHFPYFDLYRKQVVKQADLVLAMHLRGDAFTLEQKMRNFVYYEPLTVRDSSLSASTQAVIAAEVGQLQLAYDYLGEAALMDLDNLERNTLDGLHIASLAGAWTALVAGFGGMRSCNGELSFKPRLPRGIHRLAFNLLFLNRRLRVEVNATEASYRLLAGEPLNIKHHGDEITLALDTVMTRAIPPIKAGPRPLQPPGRVPFAQGSSTPHRV
ncbi:MAG TPA: glycosyl hydrolase family 65 protein [Ktedonobacteraceae bacterium]|nr:glycosyl hydrolase family 65 protein [Ktedonobacteraceae bacterium]